MKNRLICFPLSLLAGLALLANVSSPAHAQPKIATIDLRKVFDGYYKTKQADAQLKNRREDAEKQLKGMMDDYKKANDEYNKLIETSNDQAISAEERAKRKKSAESKLLELQDVKQNIQKFQAAEQANLDEQRNRMRERILGEIREVINAKAKAGNYTLVVDSAAESRNMTPIILYFTVDNDLTDVVLKDLNPPGSPTFPDEKPKPAEKGK